MKYLRSLNDFLYGRLGESLEIRPDGSVRFKIMARIGLKPNLEKIVVL